MMKYILLVLLQFVIVACSQSTTTESKDTLVVGTTTDAVTLYPYGSNDIPSLLASAQIFDRLVEKDAQGQIVGSLATEWEFVSPTVLQMTLRPNVKFHNGEILKASDVKYSLERMIKAPAMAQTISPVKEVQVINDLTFQIILKDTFAPILAHLAQPATSILNEASAEAAGENIDQQPVGTGPYMLSSWERGNLLTLTRFDDYWGDVAKIKNLQLQVIGDESARTIALEAGDVDISLDVSKIDRDRIVSNPDLTLVEEPLNSVEYLGINLQKNPIWKDVRVRQAVAYAVNSQGITDGVYFGAAKPAVSILPERVIGHYSGLTPREYSLEKAKALLSEAGIPVGAKFTIFTTDGPRMKVAEVIQASLREIGLDVTISVYEWGRFIEATGRGEHDTYVLSWTTGTGDADYGLYNMVHSKSLGAAGNRAFYENPKVDVLLESARKELDPTKRADLYRQIQEILHQELPYIPITYRVASLGINNRVKGFNFDPITVHKFKTVYFE